MSFAAINEQPVRAAELREFSEHLATVSARARKLLVQIAELAYHGRGGDRKADVCYLPELCESCGLDIDAMYLLLKELVATKFIEVEDQYPYEDVRVLAAASGWNVLEAVASSAAERKVSLRDILVDGRFELLR